MELILDIPMVPNHGAEGRGRPWQTGKVDAVVTRHRRLLVGHPNGFHGNHCLQARPFLQCRQGLQVRHAPDSSAYAPSVGMVERIKAMVRIAPREMGRDMLLKVRCDGCIGFFVILLSCQEVVPALVPALTRDGGLTAPRIDRDDTALDGEQGQQLRNRRELMGLGLRFDVPNDESAVIRTPGGEPMQWGQGGGARKGGLHRLAIERDERPLGQVGRRTGPGQEALVKTLGMETSQHPAKGSVRGHAVGQDEESWEPGALALATQCHVLDSFSAGEQCAHGDA
jgi:hypothetical protein